MKQSLFIFAIFFLTLSLHAEEEKDTALVQMQKQAVIEKRVGVEEKLGDKIDLGLDFFDEEGKLVKIGDIINGKPTLLLLVFYSCPDTCSIMMAELGNALKGINKKENFQVLTISFDDEEAPLAAKRLKRNFIDLPGEDFPPSKWRFLWGNHHNMDILTKSLGYRYFKLEKHNFVHPNVLISIAPDGTIIRYLHGPSFLAFDLSMAITEASKGTPATSIKKLLSYCFSYDPKGKKYVFNSFRVVGSTILLTLLGFFIFLLRSEKKGPKVTERKVGQSLVVKDPGTESKSEKRNNKQN